MRHPLPILLLLTLSAIARAADPTQSSPPFSLLPKLKPDDHALTQQSPDGLKIAVKNRSGIGTLSTAAQFQTPFILTATARTDSNNIRLYFGPKGLLIFNWEMNGAELRFHDPKTGEQHGIANQGAVPKNAFVTIRWTITEKTATIDVDGRQRATFDGDYSHLAGTLGIGTYEGAILTVKSLDLASASPQDPAAPSLRIADARWGAPGQGDDVTARLQALVKNNRLDLGVTAATLGTPSAPKSAQLALTYDFAGVRILESFPQNSRLILTPPAPIVAPAGFPTTQEILDLVDAARYSDALAKLARVLPLQGPAAAAYDHHQLLMLRAECLLQMHNTTDALATLVTARRDAASAADALDAAGLQQLVQNSPASTYTSKSDKKTFDILDRTHRKDAFQALWSDAAPLLQSNTRSAVASSALPPILRAAQPLYDAPGVEFHVTGATAQCAAMIAQLRDKAASLITAAVKDQNARVDQINQSANRTIHEVIIGGPERTRKVGLSGGDIQSLHAIQSTTSQIASACQDLAQYLATDQPFADLAAQASQINQKATKLLNTSF